jgi:hypothetical protein
MGLTTKNALAILGLNASRINKTSVMSAYRAQALKHHPNKGGKRENFEKASNAKNTLLNYLRQPRYSPPPPPVYVNKSVYKNFANRKNYASWNKIKTKLGRPLKNNNISPYKNLQQQHIRSLIEYYTALNKKNTNDRLNYLYWSAFHEHRRNKKTGTIHVPRRHAIQKL